MVDRLILVLLFHVFLDYLISLSFYNAFFTRAGAGLGSGTICNGILDRHWE